MKAERRVRGVRAGLASFDLAGQYLSVSEEDVGVEGIPS
jgi:hypothetical protein